MTNTRLIKRRIKSAKNIAQITKAMELVAAAKMKKAQLAAVSGKLYAQKIYDMVLRLSGKADASHHPYLNKPSVLTGRHLVILISTNKGLCGSLNTNLFRFLIRTYGASDGISFVTIGKKGAGFIAQMKRPLTADFSTSIPFSSAVPAIIELATREFLIGGFDSVDIVYNEFFSAARQEPKRKKLLPLTLEQVSGDAEAPIDMLIEPSAKEVFNALLPHYIENQVRDAMLQAEASEHSARMVAMRNATDNALSLTDVLTLLYNKARQEKITYEITDMITARLAVE